MAVHGTSKHTSDLAKIGLLVCGPGSVEVAAGPQGRDSTHRRHGSEAAGSGCGV